MLWVVLLLSLLNRLSLVSGSSWSSRSVLSSRGRCWSWSWWRRVPRKGCYLEPRQLQLPSHAQLVQDVLANTLVLEIDPRCLDHLIDDLLVDCSNQIVRHLVQ